MDCEYCGIQMDCTTLPFCDGWKCPNCGHKMVEIGSYKLNGEPPSSWRCECEPCKLIAEREKYQAILKKSGLKTRS